jgi:replication-associated recombination protein RarA
LELDGNKPEGQVLEEIARILKLNHSNAPRRPPRVILLGPPGSGKTELANKIAMKYKLTYVKVNHMIKDYQRSLSQSSSSGPKAKSRPNTSGTLNFQFLFLITHIS